jgi:DNA-binding transcriptional LysR family regulator
VDSFCTMKNWDDLRIFHAMVDALSMRAAAAKLGTTHATVSRRLRALEADLGHALFLRKQDGLELTVFGQGVLTFSGQAAQNIAAIDRLAFAQDDGLAGVVRLSLLEGLYTSVLSDAIAAFSAQYPMIELHIETTAALSDLADRQADVVVRITQTPPEQAYGRKVADSPLAIYAAPSYLDNRPAIDQWVALDYPPAITPMFNARTVLRSGSLTVVATALRDGRGIGLLPCFIGENDTGLVRLPQSPLIPDMQIWVLTHEDVRHNQRVRALMDYLYQSFAGQRRIIEGGVGA